MRQIRPRERKYAQALWAGATGAEAAARAGYRGDKHTLESMSNKLRKRPQVIEELERLTAAGRRQAVGTREEAVERLWEMARARLGDCLNGKEKGERRKEKDDTEGKETTGPVSVVDLEAVGRLAEKVRIDPATGQVVGFELPSRQRAVELLAKLEGWNAAEKRQLEVKGGIEGVLAGMSDDEIEGLARRLAGPGEVTKI
jgi:phage terminase small subunit